MGRIISRAKWKAEQAKHKGEDHFKIFYVDENEKKKITVDDFWCKTSEEALARCKEWNDKVTDKKYFYSEMEHIICERGKGKIELFDDHDEMSASWKEEHSEEDKKINILVADEVAREKKVVADFRAFLEHYDPRHGLPKIDSADMYDDDPCKSAQAVYEDFKYFFDHYDATSSSSHMRNESWSLDHHILGDLEHNIPRLMKEKHGIPTEMCVAARKELHKDDPDFDVEADYKKNPNSSQVEFNLAEKLWNAVLEEGLEHVRLYQYYKGFGIIDEKDPAYVELDKKYKHSIPYKPMTYKELDYAKLDAMTQEQWHKIWEFWDKWGQCMWD